MSENGNIKVLNLDCGIGGNRKLWENVDVTAVEINYEVARVYQDYFPFDNLVIGDSREYLLDHYSEYDFIWCSPVCITHSKIRFHTWQNKKPIFPDLDLYQRILFLEHTFTGFWVVENVIPYYKPLIPPTKKIERHLFWANFNIGNYSVDNDLLIEHSGIKHYEKEYEYDLSKYNFTSNERRQKLRNCVHPEIGLYILNCAKGIITKPNSQQLTIFEQ